MHKSDEYKNQCQNRAKLTDPCKSFSQTIALK